MKASEARDLSVENRKDRMNDFRDEYNKIILTSEFKSWYEFIINRVLEATKQNKFHVSIKELDNDFIAELKKYKSMDSKDYMMELPNLYGALIYRLCVIDEYKILIHNIYHDIERKSWLKRLFSKYSTKSIMNSKEIIIAWK